MQVRLSILSTLCVAVLGGCATGIPDSAAGVADTPAKQYELDKAQRTIKPINGEVAASRAASDATSGDAAQLAGEARAALDSTAPADQPASGDTPDSAENAFGISEENNFKAVGEKRNIEQDKEFLARARANYKLIKPEPLPNRPSDTGPNIVQYALRTSNPVGEQIYRRGGLALESRNARNCAKYTSPDMAQLDFLRRGGPERDPKALDPDGDGYACDWNPAPFRNVRAGS